MAIIDRPSRLRNIKKITGYNIHLLLHIAFTISLKVKYRLFWESCLIYMFFRRRCFLTSYFFLKLAKFLPKMICQREVRLTFYLNCFSCIYIVHILYFVSKIYDCRMAIKIYKYHFVRNKKYFSVLIC